MQNVDVTKLNKKDEFIKTCLERFGSMNKNDFEVELFYLLQQSEYGKKTDHALSTLMQIPLTKVRRLRYEANLKHPKDEKYYRDEFINILNNGSFKTESNFIQFAVSDKSLREYLSSLLEEEGSYFDSSFNGSIIRLMAADLIILIAKVDTNEQVVEEIKKKVKDSKKVFPKNFKEQWKELVVASVKDLLHVVVPNLTTLLFNK